MRRPARVQQYAICDPSWARISSVQPDRDHAFVDVFGILGDEGISELRQRVEGLLVAGARYVLVDLSEAGGIEPASTAALAAAGCELTQRGGWLRMVGTDETPSSERYEASLSDLFAMYQAAVGSRSGSPSERS